MDDFEKLYKMESKVLGSGAFGKVYRGYMKENPSVKVAIKVLEKIKFAKHITIIKNEWKILRELDHPNIINYFGVYESKESVYIVTELWEGRELFQIYQKKKKIMNEYDAAVLMKTLIETMIHWHSNWIIHRDLKLENIMFSTEDESDYSNVRIIDFGLAAKVSKASEMMRKVVGSPYFTAPEVFEEKYDEQWDVWSLGVILYVLLGGDYPYKAKTVSLLKETIEAQDLEFPYKQFGHLSYEVKDLLSRMIDRMPSARATLEEWLEHKWFKIALKKSSEGSEAS